MNTPTLGQYFKDLRTSARRFPVLDRAAVEAMSDTQIGTELARRYWGMPSGARQGKRSSREAWINHFLKQQAAQRCPTLRDVAGRCNFDPVVVWKIEHDKPVMLENLLTAMVDGLGFKRESAEVRQAVALWTSARTAVKVDANLSASIGDAQKNATFNEFLRRAVPVLATIPASEYDVVLEALGNPAVVESLASLNKLAAGSGKPKLTVLKRKRA